MKLQASLCRNVIRFYDEWMILYREVLTVVYNSYFVGNISFFVLEFSIVFSNCAILGKSAHI